MSVPAVMTRCKFSDNQHRYWPSAWTHTLQHCPCSVCECVCVRACVHTSVFLCITFIHLPQKLQTSITEEKTTESSTLSLCDWLKQIGLSNLFIIWAADSRGRWKVKQAMFSTRDLQLIQHVKVCGESNNRELVRIRLKGFCGQFSASLLWQCLTVPLANGLYYFNTYHHHHHVGLQCYSRLFRFDSHSAIHVKSIPYHLIIWCTYIICCCYSDTTY